MKCFSVVVVVFFASLFVTARTSGDDRAFQREFAKATRAAAERVLPSIVMIEIVGTVDVASGGGPGGGGPGGGGGGGEVAGDAPTSGVIVDVTEDAAFVIASSIVASKPSAAILVVTASGDRRTASVVAKDEHRDLVLLKVKLNSGDALTPALLSEHELTIGQTTIAVGRYGGDAGPMISTGILSATGRLDGIALQTDARVSAALYGGVLVDLYGNLLGVLIPQVAEGGAENPTDWYDSGVAFAIPADVIAKKLDRLTAGQNIKKGLIGIVSKSKDPMNAGTEIAAVRTRSPAEDAGIRAGDSVTSVGGIAVTRHQEIKQALGSYDAGEVVTIELSRDGKPVSVDVTLAESIPPLKPQRLGVIADAKATITAIVPGGPADNADLAVDDVIMKINDAEIDSAAALRRQLISAEPDAELVVTARRGDKTITAKLTPSTIGGELRTGYPDAWTAAAGGGGQWPIAEIKLPESANAAAYVGPKPDDESAVGLGLLVLLIEPGADEAGGGDPKAVAKKWQAAATDAGTVVVAIAPEDNERWQPKELETIASFAAAMLKKAPIDPAAVAVASAGALSGAKATAADSMALAAAISQSKTFTGVAVSNETRPPAIRLRENEAAASLEFLMPAKDADALPSWSAALKRVGYPISFAETIDEPSLLAWVRLLQAI